MSKEKKIGVLMGGLSREREVSLRSGQAILAALLKLGYRAVGIDVDRDIASKLRSEGIEIAFLALHGRYGEDGSIQGLLEILGIPYTGSSVLSSALGLDKHLTKELLRGQGVSLADDLFFNAQRDTVEDFLKDYNLGFPVIVKPSREGSTLGIQKASNVEDLKNAILEASRFDSRVLVERMIAGREVTVTVLNGDPLAIVEVAPKSGFYDFASKYTAGATEYFCPAELPEPWTLRLKETAQSIYQRLGCEGVARADFIVASDGTCYFLEINTLPGMTATSLAPKAAAAAGISFETLVESILKSARLKIS